MMSQNLSSAAVVIGVLRDNNIFKLPKASHINIILALTCDFQQCCILTNLDSDEPMHPL